MIQLRHMPDFSGVVSPRIPSFLDDIAHTVEATLDGADSRTDANTL